MKPEHSWEEPYVEMADSLGLDLMRRLEEPTFLEKVGAKPRRTAYLAMKKRSDHSRRADSVYMTPIVWAAPFLLARGKATTVDAGRWERVDCAAGRLGSFFGAAQDSSAVAGRQPDVWWPMRPAEGAFFCPGWAHEYRELKLWNTELYRRVPDAEAQADFAAWLNGRRSAIDSVVHAQGLEFDALTAPGDSTIWCLQPEETTALNRSFGEADVSCLFSMKRPSEEFGRTHLRVRLVRLGRGTPWRPLTKNGYLSHALLGYTGGGEHDADLPAEFQPALARVMGAPLDVEEWKAMSRSTQASERADAAGG